MSRFTPVTGRGGQVYSSGLDVRARDGALPMQPRRGPYRAVVLNTYVTDSEGRGPRQKTMQVTCDVILCRTGHRINHVPVAQSSWGEHNAQPWIPRESTRVISENTALNTGARFSSRGSSQGPATRLDDLDGDNVLLDFVEGSFRHPVILCATPHERTNRIVIDGVGHVDEAGGEDYRGHVYKDEAYFRHAGVEARVSGKGDLLIDTVEATDDPTEEDTSGTTGHVRVRMKGTQRFTVEMDGTDVLEVWKDGDQVRIDLGEGAAQRLILGDAFREWLNGWIADVFEGHQHEVGTLTGSGSGTVTVNGQTGKVASAAMPPIPPLVTFLGTAMDEDLLSDLAKTKKT